MAEFKIIETQEQLDALIGDRLKRDRESYAKKFDGWKSPEDIKKITDGLNARIKSLEDDAAATKKTIEDKDAEIAKGAKYRADLEKTRIALKAGLDIKYADRLRGENAEEWEKDAKELAKDFSAAHVTAPPASHEPVMTNKESKTAARDAAFKSMLSKLDV